MSERRQRFILALFIALFFFLLGLTERKADGAELNDHVGSSHSVVGALGLDARAAALGFAVTAVDLGAANLNYNPAGMALATSRHLYLGHVDWVMDSSLSESIALLPMAGENVLGLGLLYFDQGTIDEVLDDGSYTGERLGARDLQASLGLGHRFPHGIDIGLRFMVFHKTLGWERAGGHDGGHRHPQPGHGAASASAPRSRASGRRCAFARWRTRRPCATASASPTRRSWSGTSASSPRSDFVIPRDNYNAFHAGTEWEYHELLALRVGYGRTLLEDGTPESDRFTYGAGLRLGGYRFDYAYSPKDDFDPVHRFSVNFALASPPSPPPAPLPVIAAAPVGSAPVDSGVSIGVEPLPRVTVIHGINFDIASAEIGPGSKPLLDGIYERLLHTPHVEAVEIQGHTDNTGDPEFNRRLSLERARAVRDYFVLHGYSVDKLGVMGFGDTVPVVGNDTAEGRAANRRIELHVIRRVTE